MLYKDIAGSEVLHLEDNTSVDLGTGAGERGGEWPGGQNGGEVVGDQGACDQVEEDSLCTPPVACSTLSENVRYNY